MTDPDSFAPDHIGWRLWRAADVWKQAFTAAMVARGHGWYAEARSSVTPHIGATGARQSDLVRAMGLSKQAVQQLVDDLAQEGVVRRDPDPNDRRGKIVRFTDKGLAAMRDAAGIKRELEDAARARLGDADFEALDALLRRFSGDDAPH